MTQLICGGGRVPAGGETGPFWLNATGAGGRGGGVAGETCGLGGGHGPETVPQRRALRLNGALGPSRGAEGARGEPRGRSPCHGAKGQRLRRMGPVVRKGARDGPVA